MSGERMPNRIVADPVTCTPDATIADVEDICTHYNSTGVPVTGPRQEAVGIVTNGI